MTIEERNKIFEDNINLIHYVLIKRGFNSDDEVYEDLFQECSVFVLNKLPNWNEERGNIVTYIHMLVEYAIGLFFRYEQRIPETISENTIICASKHKDDDIRICDSMVYADDTDIIKDCCMKCDIEDLFKRFETLTLSDGRRNRSLKHLHLVKERYLEGKSVITLAKKYGESRVSISKKIFQCLTILRKLIKEKGE